MYKWIDTRAGGRACFNSRTFAKFISFYFLNEMFFHSKWLYWTGEKNAWNTSHEERVAIFEKVLTLSISFISFKLVELFNSLCLLFRNARNEIFRCDWKKNLRHTIRPMPIDMGAMIIIIFIIPRNRFNSYRTDQMDDPDFHRYLSRRR